MEVQLVCSVVMMSAIWQSDSVMQIHISSPHGLSQDTEYSSQGYTAVPCYVSTLFCLFISIDKAAVTHIFKNHLQAHV